MARTKSYEQLIEPRTGTAIELKQGQILRVIDIEGEQVADLFAVTNSKPYAWLSSGRSIDYNGKLFLTKGDVLYTNTSEPLFEIIQDDAGRHDFLFTPCSQKMFEIQYDVKEENPNCLDNLSNALASFGVSSDCIHIPFNIFMRADVHPDGRVEVMPPSSKAGDAIELRAEQDLIVAVSACSAGKANNHSFSAIGIEVVQED